jgi:hypothetical protein
VVRWCRACGCTDHTDGQAATCDVCGVAFALPPVGPSRVGLVYSVKGKWFSGRQHGICLEDHGTELTLHLSAEDGARTVPTAEAGPPLDLVPGTLSPASRLLHACRLGTDGNVAVWESGASSRWDQELLLTTAGHLVGADVAARRQLANDALTLGWTDIFTWVDLTPTEKAWICAHAAAQRGTIDHLYSNLSFLTGQGYEARIALLLPHLPALRADRDRWVPLLRGWEEAGLPGAAPLRVLLEGDFREAVHAGADLLDRTLGDHASAQRWRAAAEGLEAGEIPSPPSDRAHHWLAAYAYQRGRAGVELDGKIDRLTSLPLPLLDDLVDAGTLSARADLSRLPPASRDHVRSRLVPEQLDEEHLRRSGHVAELARRRFLDRDRAGLDGLGDDPAVHHYTALFDVLEGKSPDDNRLRPEARRVLGLVERARGALQRGETTTLPGPILNDPSLWQLFAPFAQTGDLAPDDEDRDRAPDFAGWADLHRLLGLLWEGRWAEAAELGTQLEGDLPPAQAAEARNLTAFALHQRGDHRAALTLLERTPPSRATEPLLVNASILASSLHPERSASAFVRLFQRATDARMQAATLERAIAVLFEADEVADFPEELKGPLRTVLRNECTFEQYRGFIRLAGSVDPAALLDLNEPPGDKAAVFRFHVARARFLQEEGFTVEQLVEAIVSVSRRSGDERWFQDDWHQLVELFREATFVDFGEAPAPAMFWDNVEQRAPHLLSPFDRLLLLPQAGTHLAFIFDQRDDLLSEHAFEKFFLRPADELLAGTHDLTDDARRFLAENLSKTMFLSTVLAIGNSRTASAAQYNPLVERAGWDAANRPRLIGTMRNILDTDLASIQLFDRALDRLRRLALSEPDHQQRVRELAGHLEEWRAETVRLRSAL